MVKVTSKQSFKNAILSGEEEIQVDNPELAKWIVAVHAMKQGAWCIAILLISTGVAAGIVLTVSSGGAAAGGAAAGGAAISGLTAGIGATNGLLSSIAATTGLSGAVTLIGLGATLGGIAGIKTIKNKYKIKEKGEGYIILKHK